MNNIDNILKRYFEGESSIEDEKNLSTYFQSSDIREKHKIYAPIFQHFTIEKKGRVKLLNNNKKIIPLWLSIVACAVIVIGLFSIVFLNKPAEAKSVAYMDGVKIEDLNLIWAQALNSLVSVEESLDNNILESQIDILDSFIE